MGYLTFRDTAEPISGRIGRGRALNTFLIVTGLEMTAYVFYAGFAWLTYLRQIMRRFRVSRISESTGYNTGLTWLWASL